MDDESSEASSVTSATSHGQSVSIKSGHSSVANRSNTSGIETSMSADWERQQKELQENDRWEKSVDMIPTSLQDQFKAFFAPYGVILKVSVLKLLSKLDWKQIECEKIYNMLIIAPSENIKEFVELLTHFSGSKQVLNAAAELFSHLNKEEIQELLIRMPRQDVLYLMDICRFLSIELIEDLAELIHHFTTTEVLKRIHYINEPMAKFCRVCRLRRSKDLEVRLMNNQIPALPLYGLLPMTGTLSLYHKERMWDAVDERGMKVPKPRMWAADDEKGFTVDAERGVVMFNRSVVDLTRICEKCLIDAHQAVTSDTRFIDLYNIPAANRKELLKSLRDKELKIAELVGKVTEERMNRKARHFSLQALALHRHGTTQEREEAEYNERLRQRTLLREKELADKEKMIAKAMAFDPKILSQDRRELTYSLGVQVHRSQLKYHIGFDKNNPVPTEREHPHSWRLKQNDFDGTPLTVDAASKRFGTANPEPHVQFETLKNWKVEAQAAHAEYLKDCAVIEKKQRDAEFVEFQQHVLYVDRREKRMARKEELLKRQLEIEEQARLDRRAADRDARKAMRIAGYEAAERALMASEDEFSLKLRFYMWERDVQGMEREQMWNEEMEQCAVDRFWGFEVMSNKAFLEAQRLKEFYDKRTQEMRELCARSNIIRPFKLDAATAESQRLAVIKAKGGNFTGVLRRAIERENARIYEQKLHTQTLRDAESRASQRARFVGADMEEFFG